MGLLDYQKQQEQAKAGKRTADATDDLLTVTRSLYVEQRETNQWLKRLVEAVEKGGGTIG